MKFVAAWLLCLSATGQDLDDGASLLQTRKASERRHADDPDEWKKTNVAGIGSDADKALRKEAAAGEAAWEGCGQQAGIEAWRIEDFSPQPADVTGGKFYEGDSYIVLQTQEDPDSGKLTRDIFFWLGKDTTNDEKGTAAYKTVELDSLFDGEPVQHREVQGEETAAFKDLFGGSLHYLEGGVPSGFRHVEHDLWKTTLHVVHDKKPTELIVDGNFIDDDDCFVLNAPDDVHVYCGANSGNFDKFEANKLAEGMEKDRHGKAQATHDSKDEFVWHTAKYEKQEPTLLELETWADEAQAYAISTEDQWFWTRRRQPPPAPRPTKKSGLKQLITGICPKDYPFVYRPANNFDQCCASPHSKTGNDYANAKIGRSRRSNSCSGDRYTKCPSAPCHDHPNGVKATIEQNLKDPEFLPDEVKPLLKQGLNALGKLFNPNGCPVCECGSPSFWLPWNGCNIACGAKCGSTCCCIPGVGSCPNTKVR